VKDCNLGREGGAALAAQLSINTSVTDLEIVNCGLDTKAWEELATALQENRSVRKLTVGGWGWKEAKVETGPFEVSTCSHYSVVRTHAPDTSR
jgi:hypothetical protein